MIEPAVAKSDIVEKRAPRVCGLEAEPLEETSAPALAAGHRREQGRFVFLAPGSFLCS
jgi:hypothetical protein